MEITITEEGIIFCNGIACDPLTLFRTDSQCGNCPIIRIGEKYDNVLFDCIA